MIWAPDVQIELQGQAIPARLQRSKVGKVRTHRQTGRIMKAADFNRLLIATSNQPGQRRHNMDRSKLRITTAPIAAVYVVVCKSYLDQALAVLEAKVEDGTLSVQANACVPFEMVHWEEGM